MYCLQTNGHIITLFNILVEASRYSIILTPPLLQNSKGNPSAGTLNAKEWDSFFCKYNTYPLARKRYEIAPEVFGTPRPKGLLIQRPNLTYIWAVACFYGSAASPYKLVEAQRTPNLLDILHSRPYTTTKFCIVMKLHVRKICTYGRVDHECWRAICLR